jgi:hypothetical protein
LSGVCNNGACYKTSQCEAIKQSPGQTFDRDTVIIVFVGSGFSDSTSWVNQVQTTHSDFVKFPFFNDTVESFVALYATALQPSFCYYYCEGIDRLLCCDVTKAQTLAQSCTSIVSTVQIVVIHNNATYGGAGYVSLNIATTSVNSAGPLVVVHELGHALFNFGDE